MSKSTSLAGTLLIPLVLILGCGGSSHPASGKVQHVVVIMQENRSFDNLFNGFPGADTSQSGNLHGTTIPLTPVPLESQVGPDHSHIGFWQDWDNGNMDGFDFNYKYFNLPSPEFPYAYVPQSETVPLWTLASTYTLGDRMFQSNSGPSFVAHQYMIAGQSGGTDENPSYKDKGLATWGCDSPPGTTVAVIGPNGTDLPGGFPCLDYQTIGDLLDAGGVSWRYYAPSVTGGDMPMNAQGGGQAWSAFDAIKHIRYGPDWTHNVISPNTQFFTDIKNGNLAQVTWIVPDWAYSDHPGTGSTNQGPDWVGSLVNAIGASPFWESTVIFISWDDWGGWYDHVNPPQIDNMGLGFRVPLIVVSPFAKRGYVSHTMHEFSGFLRFTEETFNLPNLGTRDATADDFSDCFDFNQTMQPFKPVPTKRDAQFFLNEARSGPPDDD